MTLAKTRPHEGGEFRVSWPHEAGDWQYVLATDSSVVSRGSGILLNLRYVVTTDSSFVSRGSGWLLNLG